MITGEILGLLINNFNKSAVESGLQFAQRLLVERIEHAVAFVTPDYKDIRFKARTLKIEEMSGLIGLLIVFGGDGTMLYAARHMISSNTPILGINTGSFGFLTAIGASEIDAFFPRILRKEFRIMERPMICATLYKNGKKVSKDLAVNDVVVLREPASHVPTFKIAINGEFFSYVRGDGLIFSTPTGSTAYLMSAGGPIINPYIKGMAFCPICPHTIGTRPIILTEDDVITASMLESDVEVSLVIDGQEKSDFNYDMEVRIDMSSARARFAEFKERNFYRIVQKKLAWGKRKL